jgi:uncharacterized protein YfdQ (DUF2303 family)
VIDTDMQFLREAIDRLIEIGRLSAGAQPVPSVGQFVVGSDGEIHDLTAIATAAMDKPRRTVATLAFSDVNSFVQYWKAFAGASPYTPGLFHNGENAVTAIFDYHTSEGPDWCQHKATLTLKDTVEWATWKSQNGKPQSQADFALFIEDNAPDIVEPAQAHMIEVARNLQAKSEMNFASAVRLNNGSTDFKFTEATTATVGKSNAEVPERFTISIPLFEAMDMQRIEARLRYRVKDGKLLMWYDLWRAHKAVESAFKIVLETITEDCEKVPLFGSIR